MDLKILSAEEYSDGGRPVVGSVTYYDHKSKASDPITETSTRQSTRQKKTPSKAMAPKRENKRRSRSPSSDEAKGRQRGRPRIYPADQTAGERRRTQIRLAQRAYRQRKETTIAELNDRVSELERTINEMNSTFMAFNRAASALPSIEPGLAQNLQTVALRFSTLASSTTSNQGLEEPPEEMPALAEIPQTGNDEGHYGTAINSDTQIAEATYTAVDTLRSTDGPVLAPWGYQFSAVPDEIDRGKAEEAIETVPENQFLTEPLAMDWHPTEPIEHSLVDFPVTVDEEQNLLPLYAEPLAPPSTYSFKESTFARRLLRASYERAWRVMTDPSKTAIKYEMCKFTFCFSNSANITNWIREMSLTTTKDSLELWVAPQLHIGSAGLRYPRTSLDGAQPPPSYWADQAPMGPRRSVLAETPMPDSMTVTEIIDRVGFQGDWYDPNDVEHYLRSKGLVLSEQSSWAELGENAVPMLEAPEVPAAGSPVSSGPGTGPPSPRNEDPLATVNPVLQDTDYFWSNTAANVLDNAISNVETQGANMPPVTKEPGSNISLPFFDDSYSFLNLTKRKVVNVDKFVGTIVNDAVCLGRTPGWRKSTIDSALAMSLQEVF